jgi:hypothetical protein
MHDTGREAGSAEKYKMTESKVAGPTMLFEEWKANRLK